MNTLTEKQKNDLIDAVRIVGSGDRHKIPDGLEKIRTMGDAAKPYLAYHFRQGRAQGRGMIIVLDTIRDDWAARFLIKLLEGYNHEQTARRAWNVLKTMGKLPKEWRATNFSADLWAKCRTLPAEMPAKTGNADSWKAYVRWNLLFKVMDDDLRDEALAELHYIGADATVGLVAALEENDPDMTRTALVMLQQVGDARAADALEKPQDAPKDLLAAAKRAVSSRRYIDPNASKNQQQRMKAARERFQAQANAYREGMSNPPVSGQFDDALENAFSAR